jgi:transposase
MCEEAGVRLEYLPPYSPDFNPIEEAFAELKAWIRKNYLLADNYDRFDVFLDVALQQMSGKPGKHFRSCYIVME